jgi:hypothetical protein
MRRTQLSIAAAALLAVTLTACGQDRGARAPAADAPSARVTITEGGTRLIARTDPRTGLRFEVQSSPPEFGGGSGLYIRATSATPQSVRDQLDGARVTPSCRVPGIEVQSYSQAWPAGGDHVGTALLPDDPNVVVAERVSTCELAVGIVDPATASPLATVSFRRATRAAADRAAAG